jgi:N6-L-threonylcarbamoyladenine synthase
MNGSFSRKYLLACESSCDETAFSIFDCESESVRASLILSQEKIHSLNGGIIPELASHHHYHALSPLLTKVLEKASLAIEDIDVFAATAGPGLPGALSLGFTFTKALAWAKQKPFIPVNHLEGHIYSTFLSEKVPFPHLCISLSGGHTSAYLVSGENSYTLLGKTRDDACGECFDKIAKLLSLGYPGGPRIEEFAKRGGYENYRKYPISSLEDGSISFSGLKTAVLYDVIRSGFYDEEIKMITQSSESAECVIQVASSLQFVITAMIEKWIALFLCQTKDKIKAVTLVGGVACNQIIKERITSFLEKKNIPFFTPLKKYCCDNADMIAYVAAKKINTLDGTSALYSQELIL